MQLVVLALVSIAAFSLVSGAEDAVAELCSQEGAAAIVINQCQKCGCENGKIGMCNMLQCEPKGCAEGYDKNKCRCRNLNNGKQELICITEYTTKDQGCALCAIPGAKSVIYNQATKCSCHGLCSHLMQKPKGCPAKYDRSKCCCQLDPTGNGQNKLDCIEN